MIKQLKRQVWNLLNKLGLGGSVQLYLQSALKDYGWFRSFHQKQSIDAQGRPLPWYTYAFIAFLTPRLKADFEVFEYGSGNSTRWYAQRVRRVVSVEHDQDWVRQISAQMPENVTLLTRPLDSSYVEAVAAPGRLFDLIVVDGRQRVACTKAAVKHLTKDGVLILDNSEREAYQEAKDFMQQQGFRRIDFVGMAPIVGHETCTTLFYRAENCLEI